MSLEELMPDTEGFPTGKGVDVIRGKTLVKTGTWLKAILLVKAGKDKKTGKSKRQIRLYGWQKDKDGVYKQRQKFNIAKGTAERLATILMAFTMDDSVDDEDES